MTKKPTNTLTWRKDDKYVTIERTFTERTMIDKTTGKELYKLQQIAEIPPITRRHKHK